MVSNITYLVGICISYLILRNPIYDINPIISANIRAVIADMVDTANIDNQYWPISIPIARF